MRDTCSFLVKRMYEYILCVSSRNRRVESFNCDLANTYLSILQHIRSLEMMNGGNFSCSWRDVKLLKVLIPMVLNMRDSIEI